MSSCFLVVKLIFTDLVLINAYGISCNFNTCKIVKLACKCNYHLMFDNPYAGTRDLFEKLDFDFGTRTSDLSLWSLSLYRWAVWYWTSCIKPITTIGIQVLIEMPDFEIFRANIGCKMVGYNLKIDIKNIFLYKSKKKIEWIARKIMFTLKRPELCNFENK